MEIYEENNGYDRYLYENEKIDPIKITDKYNTFIYKANMGMGKTESLQNILNSYQKVLIISFRISLDVQYVEQFDGFELYSDLGETIDLDYNNKVVIQINSLHKIIGRPDIIILDEITYTLDTLMSLEQNREKCYDVLEQYMKSDVNLIIMDALLEQDILNWLTSFNRKIIYIENTFKKHKNIKINYYNYYWSQFKNDLIKDIENGKKISFVTNCRKRLLYIKDKLDNNYKNIKTLFIDRDSENKYNIELWDKVDFLGYTPTITAGVSFTKKHYDKIYGYFINNSATAEMSIQQLFRIRNLNDNEINICIENKEKNDFPEDNDEIDNFISDYDKSNINHIKFLKVDVLNKKIIMDRYYYLYKYINKLKFKSYNNYFQRMKDLLVSQGVKTFNIIENNINEKDKKTELKEIREFNSEIKKEEAKSISNALDIDKETHKYLKNKSNISVDERNSCKKYDFMSITQASEVTPEIYTKYNRYYSQLNNSVFYYAFKDDIWTVLNTRLTYLGIKKYNEDNKVRLHMNKKYEQMAWVIYIIHTLGFDYKKILEYKEDFFIKMDKDKIKEFMLSNHKFLETTFRTKKYDWENIIKENDKWFNEMFRYLNARIKKVFRISILRKTINKNICIYMKYNDFWKDDEVTYKNDKLLQDVIKKQTEIDDYIYENIDDYYKTDNKLFGKDDEIFDTILVSLSKILERPNCIKCNVNSSSYKHNECLYCRFNIKSNINNE